MGGEIIPSDNKLLEVYMWGFDDELWGRKNRNTYINSYLRSAYEHGRSDAIIGDDVSSNDNQSDEEILEKIKNNL